MNIETIRTDRIEPQSSSLIEVLDNSITTILPNSVIAITSKIVSLCEGSVVAVQGTDLNDLIKFQSDLYLPESESMYGINFTVTDNTLIPNAGIDESNAGEVYVLWPKDAQATANFVRKHLSEKFDLQNLGVIITDSTCSPLRRGVTGIALAFSGFKPLKDYVGTLDLFNRPFKVSQSSIVGGLAAAAVLVMGEGAESTPIAVMSNIEVAEFVSRDPTDQELDLMRIGVDEDLFAPFLNKTNWMQGGKGDGIK